MYRYGVCTYVCMYIRVGVGGRKEKGEREETGFVTPLIPL